MTKTATFIRHGEHEHDHLTETGRRQVEETARQMIADRNIPAVILHSPAERTTETAALIAQAFNDAGYKVPLKSTALLADSKPQMATVEALRGLGDNGDNILAVTHDNCIRGIATIFGDRAPRYQAPKPAQGFKFVACVDRWQDIARGNIAFTRDYTP